jgi:hypothetical protein
MAEPAPAQPAAIAAPSIANAIPRRSIVLIHSFQAVMKNLLVLVFFFYSYVIRIVGKWGKYLPAARIKLAEKLHVLKPQRMDESSQNVDGYAQGKTSAACIQMIAKRPEETGKAVILPAMVETYAVLSLLMSIILLNGISL